MREQLLVPLICSSVQRRREPTALQDTMQRCTSVLLLREVVCFFVFFCCSPVCLCAAPSTTLHACFDKQYCQHVHVLLLLYTTPNTRCRHHCRHATSHTPRHSCVCARHTPPLHRAQPLNQSLTQHSHHEQQHGRQGVKHKPPIPLASSVCSNHPVARCAVGLASVTACSLDPRCVRVALCCWR